jgi:aromatic-L-amino-acid/L-tryptophan decarboxylase
MPPLTLSVEEMRRVGYQVIDAIVDRYAQLNDLSTGRKADPATIRPYLIGKLQDGAEDFSQVLRELREDVLPFNGAIDHPRFFAFVPGPSNYVGAMGDALASGFNVFAGTWLEGSGAIAVELAVVDFLRRECGLPETAMGLFVSGGSMANVTALTTAREVKLGGDCTNARAYFSTQTHSSIERGFRLIGFRQEQLVRVDADGRGCVYLPALRARIERDFAAGLRPFCIVANAGTTNTGAVDPFPELAELAEEFGLWLHADGAYGAAAVLCDRGKRLLHGLDRVDSLSFDPHKWLFQPFECGCVIVREGKHLKNTFQIYPDYLADVHRHDAEVNLCDYGIQLTRGFRALKLWLSLRVFGISAFREAVDRGFVLAEEGESYLRAKADRWEVLSAAQMAVVVFRFRGSDDDQVRIVDRMYERGYAFVTSTKYKGRTALRLCTINPRTTVEDVRSTIDLLDEIATLPQSPDASTP